MRTLAPIRIRCTYFGMGGDWRATCRVCGDHVDTFDHANALEFAYGHMAVMHPYWRHNQAFRKHLLGRLGLHCLTFSE